MTSQEMYDLLSERVDISTCIISGLNRKASIQELTFRPLSKVFIIKVMVFYFEESALVENIRFQPYTKELIATNDNLVDSNGNISPDGHIGEYDFYYGIFKSGLLSPNTLINALTSADSSGRFD